MKTALKKIFTFFVNLFKSKDMKSEIYTILLLFSRRFWDPNRY